MPAPNQPNPLRHQAVPERQSDLLPVDRWVASSLLQKAIRRGEAEIAQRAAATLHDLRPRTLWRRLIIIAFEDIGAGSPEAVAETVRTATDPQMRADLGGDRKAALAVTRRLAAATKERCAEALVTATAFHPDLEPVRELVAGLTVSERLKLAEDAGLPLTTRAAAAWYASGISGAVRVGPGDLSGLMQTFLRLGIPKDLVTASQLGALATRDPMSVVTPLVWLEASKDPSRSSLEYALTSSPTVRGVPAYALDKHTAVGKAAIARFVRENGQVRSFLPQHVRHEQQHGAGCKAVFYAEGAVLARRVSWSQSEDLEALVRETDFIQTGVPRGGELELIATVRANLDHLNEIRAQLWQRRRTGGRHD